MGWGNSWSGKAIAEQQAEDKETLDWSGIKELGEKPIEGLAIGESYTMITLDQNNNLKFENIPYANLKPTHDPYTNPNAHIYYECACGAILDPKTKSFAALNNCASNKGWKIRFGERGYIPYCVKCGEGLE